MAEWTVTEEAVQMMTEMSDRLYETIQTIMSESQQLADSFEENEDGLGYHSAAIACLLDEIAETEAAAEAMGFRLVIKVRKAAAVRKAHIEKGYSGGSPSGPSEAPGTSKPGGTAGLGGTKSPAAGSAQAEGMSQVDPNSPEYISYVLHELDTLRDSLELTEGDPEVLQLGGFHGAVRKDVEKKAAHFESHHIPSQGALADDPDNLPTIAISKDDHQLTDSYAGKQRKRYISLFPDVPPSDAYKAGVIKEILEGKFAEIVRDEIYNIREQCGTKYDGAIAQYFDALKRYIEKNGVPKARRK